MKRKAPWFYYLIAAVGLPLYLWAFNSQAHLAALPKDFPPAHVSFPVLFQGKPVGSIEEVRFLAEGIQPGSRVALVCASGDRYESILIRAHSLSFLLVTLISGLFFWAVSAFVFAPRVGRSAVRDFFWCTFLYGLAIMIGGVYFPRDPVWASVLRSIVQLTCLAVLPPLFVHLTLSFPRRHRILERFPILMPILGLIACLLILWQVAAFFRYTHDPNPELRRAFNLPQSLADILLVGQVAGGFAVLFQAGRRLELTREKQQTKWLLWGMTVGVTPYVFLRTFVQLIGLTPPFGAQFDRILELAVPIAFVFAVVRYQFLDIDIIIRRSMIYAILAAVMVGIYLAFGILVGRRIEGTAGGWSLLLPVAIGVGAGMMFHPLREAIGRSVDRTFFKISHGYGQALASLRPELEVAKSQVELAETLSSFLTRLLHPRAIAVVLREGEHLLVAGGISRETVASALGTGPTTPFNASRTVAMPNSTSIPEVESTDFAVTLENVGVVLVEPLRSGDQTCGLVLLGRKETERRYIDADIVFIRSAATEAGKSLERIRLVQLAAEEASARHRSEELNRMKSDFLSRVAHDLRTPLASISWSTDNILDGVTGEVPERQAEYLHSIRASAAHLNRLVSNLLDVSQIEQGRAELEMGRVDLGPVLEQAITTVRPLAQEKSVALVLLEGVEAVPVRGNADKLLEVVVNLLDNAIKYSPPGSPVEILVSKVEEDRLAFSVRDHGPGFGTVDPGMAFDRFRQGETSPYGGRHGFGLGLYIVKVYVELMNGNVRAENHPSGGAILTCVLHVYRRGKGNDR